MANTRKNKVNQATVDKYIEEARYDTEQRARDQRDYETMLMDYIRKEFEGM